VAKEPHEHALAAIKAWLSAVPPFGGAIASLISDYVPSSTHKNVQAALKDLTSKVEKLQSRLDVDAVNKEEFSELFKSCYLTIIRSHHKERSKAATSLIANILLKDNDEDKLDYTELDHFARCLDFLSIGAIQVLSQAYDMSAGGHPGPRRSSTPRFEFGMLLEKTCASDADLLMGLVGELSAMNLLHMTGAPGVRTANYGNYPIELTPLGVRFVERVLEWLKDGPLNNKQQKA